MMFPSYALLSGIALYASAASAATWLVDVSNASAFLAFEPNNITAAVGDIVEFRYNPKNHSVTQSSFAEPCKPLSNGFNFGFIPVANGTATADLPTRQLLVNDTKPIWIYCSQGSGTPTGHCEKGMVFAVNAGLEGSNNSFSLFQGNAISFGLQLANATNATTTPTAVTTYGSATSKPSSTGIGGSSSNGAISMNIDGANAMLMAGLGMVVGLMV